ncbi:MAG: mevalonate kinase, partial [Pseudomonadota bacterium]
LGLAVPIANALGVRINTNPDSGNIRLSVPEWGIACENIDATAGGIEAITDTILKRLQIGSSSFHIEVTAPYAAGMGLGASASYAVALIRALDAHFGLGLDDEQVNDHAFAAEKIAHGQPSGIDNTLATYGQALAFQRGDPTCIEPLAIAEPLELVVALATSTRATSDMVAKVGELKDELPSSTESVLDACHQLSTDARAALMSGDLDALGSLMSMNHGLLAALGVSTRELDDMVATAIDAGALGAKLTGGGGGGAIVAICTQASVDNVRAAFEADTIRSFHIHVDKNEIATL